MCSKSIISLFSLLSIRVLCVENQEFVVSLLFIRVLCIQNQEFVVFVVIYKGFV